VTSWSSDQTILEERGRDKVERFSGLGMWLTESIDRKSLSVLEGIVFVNLHSTTLSLKLYSAVSAEIHGGRKQNMENC